jgi:hypothetical protein
VLTLGDYHVDGLLHPSYTTMHVATFRTSATDTNIQNWPKRRHREFRKQVVAPPGHIILSCDEGQIQGRIYGMASKDPVLCQSFIDKEDIHSHWLGKLIDIYPEYFDRLRHKLNLETAPEAVLRKKGRDLIKTDFVFASLFGTTAENCAERTGIPFAVISDLLGDFWARFHVAKKWLNARRAEYRDTGGVRTLNGQMRFGVMTGNEPIIQPIQNGEAVIILDCQNELQKMAIERNDMYFMPRINVHDDLTFIVPDQDDLIEYYLDIITEVMTKIRYRWQIVPLIVEASVGYNWGEMEEIKVVQGDYVRGNVVPFRPPPDRDRDPTGLVWRFEEGHAKNGKSLWVAFTGGVRCMIIQSGSTTGNSAYTSSTYSLSDPAYYQPGNALFGTSDRYPRKENHRSIREAIAFAESIKTLPDLYRLTVPGPKNRDNGPAEWRTQAMRTGHHG